MEDVLPLEIKEHRLSVLLRFLGTARDYEIAVQQARIVLSSAQTLLHHVSELREMQSPSGENLYSCDLYLKRRQSEISLSEIETLKSAFSRRILANLTGLW